MNKKIKIVLVFNLLILALFAVFELYDIIFRYPLEKGLLSYISACPILFRMPVYLLILSGIVSYILLLLRKKSSYSAILLVSIGFLIYFFINWIFWLFSVVICIPCHMSLFESSLIIYLISFINIIVVLFSRNYLFVKTKTVVLFTICTFLFILIAKLIYSAN